MCDVKVKRAKSMYKMLGIFIFEPQYIVRTVVSYACECCVSLYPGLISLVYPAQWAKTQKKLYTECTWLFLLCIDVPKKSINHFIHRFCPFYLYVAHMYLQGKNRKNSCENYRSPHILAHSTTTYHPGFSAGLLWWYWGRAWGPNDAAIMTFFFSSLLTCRGHKTPSQRLNGFQQQTQEIYPSGVVSIKALSVPRLAL